MLIICHVFSLWFSFCIFCCGRQPLASSSMRAPSQGVTCRSRGRISEHRRDSKAGCREDMSVIVGLVIRSRIQSLTALESEYNKSPEEDNGSGAGLVSRARMRTRTRTRTNTLPIAVGARVKRRRLSPKTSARACAVWRNAGNAWVL